MYSDDDFTCYLNTLLGLTQTTERQMQQEWRCMQYFQV